MALLRTDDGRIFECDGNTMVGRGLTEGMSFDEPDGFDPEVSSIHAAITWNPKSRRWEIRDLGSHNGTFIDGARLAPGDKAIFKPGLRLVFGRLGLSVIDDEPPPAHATCARTGEVRHGRGGVLPLPDEHAPEVVVVRGDGGWRIGPPSLLESELDDPGETAVVEGVTPVSAGGRQWAVWVPSIYRRTRSNHVLDDYRVIIEITDGGDRIGLLLEREGETTHLGVRVHNELIWILALKRLEDIAADVSPSEQGWVTQESLITSMRLRAADPIAHLNMLVYRARQQVEPYVPNGYKEFIERHPQRKGTLRIGATALVIDDHGAPG